MNRVQLQVTGLLVVLGMAVGTGVANADLLSVPPSQALELREAVDGAAEVAFRFDLSGLRSGSGRRIDMAFLEWTVTGSSNEATQEFALYPVTSAWTPEVVASGVTTMTIDRTALSVWEITPVDHERGNGSMVRLDVTSLVQAWVDGSAANHGVAVAMPIVGAGDLGAEPAQARLVIYYGFSR